MKKEIIIDVDERVPRVELAKLSPLQGDLKNLEVADFQRLRLSILDEGFFVPLFVWKAPKGRMKLMDGHQRVRVLTKLESEGYKIPKLPVVYIHAKTQRDAKKRLLAITSAYGRVSRQGLYEFLEDLDPSMLRTHWSIPEFNIDPDNFLAEFFKDAAGSSGGGEDSTPLSKSLSERFLVPPFSVLDTRQGYWQSRKQQWLDLGIKSELGRGENALGFSQSLVDEEKRAAFDSKRTDGKGKRANAIAGGSRPPSKYLKDGTVERKDLHQKATKITDWVKAKQADGSMPDNGGLNSQTAGGGTSVFDPVLCELAYRWFSPLGGSILDPFAGGSVRGVVAAKLDRQYYGVELRQEQVSANREQASELCAEAKHSPVWACGDSQDIQEHCKGVSADLIFSCPPYADLEVYSDDPKDLSTMEYKKFVSIYWQIIKKSVEMLKPDRFTCFVVGEVREKKAGGFYRGFVQHTIAAFEDAGAKFYNELILVTSVGSLAIRAAKPFLGSRKVGKTHQNVLVFCKGDPKKAAAACGEIEVAFPGDELAALSGSSESAR